MRLKMRSPSSYFLGGFGRLFDSPAIHREDGSVIYDAIIPSMLSTLPDILVGVVIVLVLSASMSTLSSLVLTSSSTLTLDFLKDNIIKKMSEKKQLLCMRVLLVFFIVWDILGCAGRRVFGPVPLWAVLEGRDPCGCLG